MVVGLPPVGAFGGFNGDDVQNIDEDMGGDVGVPGGSEARLASAKPRFHPGVVIPKSVVVHELLSV